VEKGMPEQKCQFSSRVKRRRKTPENAVVSGGATMGIKGAIAPLIFIYILT